MKKEKKKELSGLEYKARFLGIVAILVIIFGTISFAELQNYGFWGYLGTFVVISIIVGICYVGLMFIAFIISLIVGSVVKAASKVLPEEVVVGAVIAAAFMGADVDGLDGIDGIDAVDGIDTNGEIEPSFNPEAPVEEAAAPEIDAEQVELQITRDPSNPGFEFVHGYMRQDGTYVAGYWRTIADGIEWNNLKA